MDDQDVKNFIFANKIVVTKGYFWRGKLSGTYEAELIIQFDGNCQIINVQNTCEHHENHTSMVLSPCLCMQILLQHTRKKFVHFPIKDSDLLYPSCLQSRVNYDYLYTNSKDGYIQNFNVKIPSFEFLPKDNTSLDISHSDGSPLESLHGSEVFESAPKYRYNVNGQRVRSNGESILSVRLHMSPRHNREGSITSRLTGNASKI